MKDDVLAFHRQRECDKGAPWKYCLKFPDGKQDPDKLFSTDCGYLKFQFYVVITCN
jgi:hypothetical protein